MKEIVKADIAGEIIKLHKEVVGQLRLSLKKGIRIGELLVEQKGRLKHGKWLPWIEHNLPFDERTARRYMSTYHNRNLLKSDNVSNLTGAYKLLAKPEPDKLKELSKKLIPPKGYRYVGFAPPLPRDKHFFDGINVFLFYIEPSTDENRYHTTVIQVLAGVEEMLSRCCGDMCVPERFIAHSLGWWLDIENMDGVMEEPFSPTELNYHLCPDLRPVKQEAPE